MKNIFKAVILSIVLLASGCIKDNGNYDYTTDSQSITISPNMMKNPVSPTLLAFVFKQGEEIKIDLEYTINDPSLAETEIAYQWILGGETVCTEKTLSLRPMPAGKYYGVVNAIDTRFDQVYAREFNFQVDPSYTSGIVILSDNGTNAQLGYLYKDTKTGEFGFSADIYGSSNNGATLASGAGPLVYHPYSDGIEYALTIVQGGEDGPIDLNAHDMLPYAKIKDTFIGNTPSSSFKDIIYKENTLAAYALTDDGHIYMRDEISYNGAIVPQAGRFSAPYVAEEGCRIQHIINNSLLSSMFTSVREVLGYDSLNHRCFYIDECVVHPFTSAIYTNANEPFLPGDPGYDGNGPVEGIAFPGPENLEGYEVKKMIACGYDVSAWLLGSDPFTVVAMILQDGSGKNYLLAYDFYYVYQSVDVDLRMFCEWPVEINPDTIVMPDNMGADETFFFTDKDNRNIYHYNLNYGSVKKVYTSDETITTIRRGEIGNAMGFYGDPGIYANVFVVGTESGKITVLNMDATAIATGSPEVLFETRAEGKITAMEYMSNDMVSY